MGKVTIVKKVYFKPRVEFVDFSLAGSLPCSMPGGCGTTCASMYSSSAASCSFPGNSWKTA